MGREEVGAILFFASMVVFTTYVLLIFIPAINADLTNSNAIMNVFLWAIGCGLGGTIGAILAE